MDPLCLTLRVQVPNYHILSKIVTYITIIPNPSTQLLGPLDPLGCAKTPRIWGAGRDLARKKAGYRVNLELHETLTLPVSLQPLPTFKTFKAGSRVAISAFTLAYRSSLTSRCMSWLCQFLMASNSTSAVWEIPAPRCQPSVLKFAHKCEW